VGVSGIEGMNMISDGTEGIVSFVYASYSASATLSVLVSEDFLRIGIRRLLGQDLSQTLGL
jgi:hypothetical protein